MHCANFTVTVCQTPSDFHSSVVILRTVEEASWADFHPGQKSMVPFVDLVMIMAITPDGNVMKMSNRPSKRSLRNLSRFAAALLARASSAVFICLKYVEMSFAIWSQPQGISLTYRLLTRV